MKVKSQSEVAESCLTLSDPMDCSLPGSSVHGIFQARVLDSILKSRDITLPTKVHLVKAMVSPVVMYGCAEKAMAPHSSTLAWKIPWREVPGRLQSMRSLRVGHD